MITRQIPILVDTNIIAACHQLGCWKSVAGFYWIETVDKCVNEFQTGGHALNCREYVDEVTLRAQFRRVNEATELERAAVALAGGNALDVGERELWAHALGRSDAWVLSGPDRTSMNFGCAQGHGDRLIALEVLLKQMSHAAANRLPQHFRQGWLDQVRRKSILGIL